MECPKKEILASLVYMQRLIKQGDLDLQNTDNANKVADNIVTVFKKAMNNVKKSEKNNKEGLIGFNLIAKTMFYSMNYEMDKKPETENITSKIILSKDKDYKLDVNPLNMSELVEKNQNVSFDFGDKDKVYYMDIRRAGNTISDNQAKKIMDIINNTAQKFGLFENEKFNPYSDEYFIERLMDEITSFIDARKHKAEKETLFYSGDTEIKLPYFTKELIEEALKNIADDVNDYAANTNVFANLLKNHYSETEKNLVDDIFNILKDNTNEQATKNLLSIVDGSRKFISSSLPDFLREYEDILKINNTIEFKTNIDNKNIVLPNLVKEKEKTREHKAYLEFTPYKTETDEDIPIQQKKIPLEFKDAVLELNLKKKEINIKNFNFTDKVEVDKLYKTNKAQNVSFYIPHTYKDKLAGNALIDEVDRGADGVINEILRYCFNNEETLKVLATGSPVTTSADSLVGLLAFMGKIDIEENVKNFIVQSGVFDIRNEYDALIFNSISKSDKLTDMTVNIVEEYMQKANKKNKSFNETKFFFEKADNFLQTGEKDGAIEFVGKIDVFKFSKSLSKISSGFMRNKELFNRENLKDSLILLFLKNIQTYLKKVPQITNPKSVVGLIASIDFSNISIMTREKLKGREEKINILDKTVFFETKEKLDKKEVIPLEEVEQNNDLKIRAMQLAIDYMNSKFFTTQAMEYLKNTFRDFSQMFINDKAKENNIKSLSAILEIDENDIKNYLQKTTVSGNDDINSIYSKYLKLNGNFDKLKESFVKDDYSNDKIEFFIKFTKIFDYYFKALPNFVSEVDKNSFKLNENEFIKTGNYKYQAVFKTGGKDGKEFPTASLQGEYGYPEKMIFSLPVELGKEIYTDFLKPEKDENGKEYYLKYNLEITNSEENMILDARASKGIQQQIEEVLKENKSTVISSSRVAGLVFNFLDTLYSAKFRTDKSKPLSIIVNETSSTKDFNLKDILSRIDDKYLKKHNIIITPVKRNLLDSQVKVDKSKGYQIALLSNYESISRGLDLSMLDIMIATGAMAKGNELVQFSARPFSVTKDEADYYLLHNGKDVDFFVKKINDLNEKEAEILINALVNNADMTNIRNMLNDESLVAQKAPQTAKIQDNSLKILDVYKLFMSGEGTNITTDNNAENSNLLVTVTDKEINTMLDQAEAISGNIKIKK